MEALSKVQAVIVGVLTAGLAAGAAFVALALIGPAPQSAGLPAAISTVTSMPPTATKIPTQTPTPPPPTLTPTPSPVDYSGLEASLDETLTAAFDRFAFAFDVGIAFIDLETGQQVTVNGDLPYYSLSTFKAPLAAYYLHLVEQGELTREPSDDAWIEPMLSRSDNAATTCIIRRVGGLAGFNDYLVSELNMLRERNYIIAWDTWACEQDGTPWYPASDLRYIDGDPAVGLDAVGGLRPCPSIDVRCDKVFTPIDLAQFYQSMAVGELLNAEHTDLWFSWMAKDRDNSALFEGLPDDSDVQVFVKNGFRAEDDYYDRHFYHESGIIKTPAGSFVLVVFTQGNPDWPGTWLHADLAAAAYRAFIEGHTDA